jgi:hypothetical protein
MTTEIVCHTADLRTRFLLWVSRVANVMYEESKPPHELQGDGISRWEEWAVKNEAIIQFRGVISFCPIPQGGGSCVKFSHPPQATQT